MVTLEDAKDVARVLAKEVLPIAVLVFGSVARLGQGDDLDILVVTDKDDMGDSINRSLRDFYKRFAIDYFIISFDTLNREFRKGSPFLRLIQKEGRALYVKESLEKWREYAREDFNQAKYLLKGDYYRGACFSSQQAIEKSIKAELLGRGWELEKIHNVRRLMAIAEDHNLHVVLEDQDIDFIDSVYRGRDPAEEGLLPLN